MTNTSTIVLVPFLFAFLVFTGRFYIKESASSKLNPSFLLAFATVALAGAYLALGVTHRMPEYGMIGFGVAGLALLGVAIYRIFIF